MKKIGVTGGVGCGKSEVLAYLEEAYGAAVLRTDEISRDLMEPGGDCHDDILALFGPEFVLENGSFDRLKIAERVFREPVLLDRLNAILHPATISRTLLLEEEAEKNGCPVVCVESALVRVMREKGNETYDELWYVYADEAVRRQRLKESRGYTDQKIDSIMANQPSEREFREACDAVIDNSGAFAETRRQIDLLLQ